MTLGRILAISRKEVWHILRDPFTLGLALGLPLLLVLFFGYVIDFDLKELKMVIYDNDQSPASRRLIETFSSSGFFKTRIAFLDQSPIRVLDANRASVVLIIEPDFGKNISRQQSTKAQVLVDGTDNSTAGVILGYLGTIQKRAAERLQKNQTPRPPIQIKTRFLFNPELNSKWFVVPGLIVVVMSILAVLLTALTVAREWETGSMELLLSTPLHPIEIILGKLGPYIVLGLTAVLFVYLMSRLLFDIPFAGNHFFFLITCLIFLSTTLAQGLLISVVTRQQQLAMQISIVSGLLPSILLSGFVFSIENMPVFFQYFTSILPAKWFMMTTRGIFLKGAGIAELAKPVSALLLINLILLTLAGRKFKRDLEP